MSELARLAGSHVAATGAMKVLEIGVDTDGCTIAIAAALPPDGLLLAIVPDGAAAAAARTAIARAGHGHKSTVIAGDPARYLHKIAGPFDLMLLHGGASDYNLLHERLVRLLAPGATLIADRRAATDDYNRVLAADDRFGTISRAVNETVVIAVRRAANATEHS
jgi:predicted O-methyltransferase YrrM